MPMGSVTRKGPPPRLEKVEQADGVRLLRSLGAHVYVLGTVRPRGDRPTTMQTPGLADIEAWLPRPKYRPGAQRDARRLLKWEVKRQGEKLRPEQIDYRQTCIDAGVAHVVGPCATLIDWLAAEGYIIPSSAEPITLQERSC